MSQNNVLSASGSITKKEIVRTVKVKSKTGQLILESSDPFPEVHTKLKKKHKLPRYFYIAINPRNLDQDILIAARDAEREMLEELNSAIGDIQVNEETFHVIRLKNISTKILGSVLKAYESHGVEICNFEKNINDPAIITTKKFFYLEEVEQGFYLDLDEQEKGYLEIPRLFKWEEFEKITQKVKEDSSLPEFDGAIGVITKHGVNQNIIRIYTPHLDQEKLIQIGKGYIKHLFI
jgi:hypothetical protein